MSAPPELEDLCAYLVQQVKEALRCDWPVPVSIVLILVEQAPRGDLRALCPDCKSAVVSTVDGESLRELFRDALAALDSERARTEATESPP